MNNYRTTCYLCGSTFEYFIKRYHNDKDGSVLTGSNTFESCRNKKCPYHVIEEHKPLIDTFHPESEFIKLYGARPTL